MIGLPSETEDDVRGIAELAAKVAAAGGRGCEVTASVSTFVPKPHTPFQWAAQLDVAETEARQSLLRRELGRRGIEFKWHDARSRGSKASSRAAIGGSARARSPPSGSAAASTAGPITAASTSGSRRSPSPASSRATYLRRRSLDEMLPWDHLDCGVTKEFLQQELARAVEGQLTPDCSIERCTYCGACDFTAVTQRRLPSARAPRAASTAVR